MNYLISCCCAIDSRSRLLLSDSILPVDEVYKVCTLGLPGSSLRQAPSVQLETQKLTDRGSSPAGLAKPNQLFLLNGTLTG